MLASVTSSTSLSRDTGLFVCWWSSGAIVNWVMSYPQMRAANVLGTAEVLQLATKHHLKVVHYVSTVSTAPTHGDETSVMPHEQVLRASGCVLAASTLWCWASM